MDEATKATLSKVPEVTLSFWIIKITATTLGETGGDSVTMTLNWGYLAGTAIFLAALIALVAWQIAAKKFHPFLYWATIVASTTFGTTMADFADRSLGIGYTGGSTLLFLCLMMVLGLWYWSEGTISVNTVSTPKIEAFYWAAITFSQTLGTALGDWLADTGGLGYEGGALVFGAGLAILAAAYYWTKSLAGRSVLGGVYPHPTAWSHSWRLSRQAGKPWRAQLEPPACIGRTGDLDRCMCAFAAPTAGQAPKPIDPEGVTLTDSREISTPALTDGRRTIPGQAVTCWPAGSWFIRFEMLSVAPHHGSEPVLIHQQDLPRTIQWNGPR